MIGRSLKKYSTELGFKISHGVAYGKYKNYIVIEAKRDKDSEKDKDIVTRFIEVEEYEYKVGVTINYNKFNPIKATLYLINNILFSKSILRRILSKSFFWIILAR